MRRQNSTRPSDLTGMIKTIGRQIKQAHIPHAGQQGGKRYTLCDNMVLNSKRYPKKEGHYVADFG